MKTAYERSVTKNIKQELDSEKIILVTGPRQSGKTTLLQQLSSDLREDKQQVYYYNFDRLADLEFFKNQQKVEAFLKLRSLKQKIYVLIDEVQRKQQAGTFFKYFYDAGINAKFIFSGSSSIELNDSFGDALTGRKRVFTLLPLSIGEIAAVEMGDEYSFAQQGDPMALAKFGEVVTDKLIWGCYPEVVSKQGDASRLRALGELYESYIQKDVKDLLRVKNISGFNLLVKLLAHSIGGNLVIEELARQTGMHVNTVNSYLDILEGTMVISRSDNFNPTFAAGLPKSQHVYFFDNGMRNYALGQMQEDFRTDWDQLAMNLVFTELMKTLGRDWQIFHYQTYSDNNIDFIVQRKDDNQYSAVAVRYQSDSEKLGKKLHEFLNTQNPGKLIVVTKSLEKRETLKDCDIVFTPLAEFLVDPVKMLAVD